MGCGQVLGTSGGLLMVRERGIRRGKERGDGAEDFTMNMTMRTNFRPVTITIHHLSYVFSCPCATAGSCQQHFPSCQLRRNKYKLRIYKLMCRIFENNPRYVLG